MKKNDEYKGWKVLDVTEISDYKSSGIWLRHEATGMEIFHMLNEDPENLFGFAFKTLSLNSKGTAHIMEHSVLCGSEKYPLKDPFVVLSNQSIKTFLNALTFPDKTVYPASSLVEKDYFNVMSVYGDAVFFPLLDERIFRQEGHRFEIDEKGKLSIQGVVYNEMKGNYSSYESVAAEQIISTILPGTAYAYDSGGNPSCIPDLTYEDFLAFHKKYYSPSNCSLFLYGNIPTEKQIDFINANFLDNRGWEKIEREEFYRDDIELTRFKTPVAASKKAPISADESSRKLPDVILSWCTGESKNPEDVMKVSLLSEILLGHDGSPLSKALLDSGLGEDISPSSGMENELKYLVFSVGLRGVKKGRAKKLEKLVLDVLRDVAENGVSEEALNTALDAAEFSFREIRRFSGPYSLVLMRRCLRGWLNGAAPSDTLLERLVFDKMKKELRENPSVIKQMVRETFLDNPHRTLLEIIPDAKYDRQLKKEYEKRLKKIDTPEMRIKIKAVQDEVHALQMTQDSPEKLSLIPHIKPSECCVSIDHIKTERSKIGGPAEVPVFTHEDTVNGISYMEVGFPVDVLTEEELAYLPFFTTAATNMGFSGKDWAEAAAFTASCTGGFGASLFTSSVPKLFLEKKNLFTDGINAENFLVSDELSERLYKEDCCLGRSWIFFRTKMLDEKIETAVNMLFDCVETVSFEDEKRLENLVIEYKNDFAASIIPSGNDYAASRASCSRSRSKMIDEIWNGLTQFTTACALVKMDKKELAKILETIRGKILKAGTVVNLTSSKHGLDKLKEVLEKRFSEAKNIQYCAPVKPAKLLHEKLKALTEYDGDNAESLAPGVEFFNVPSKVGYAAASFAASPFGTKEAVSETVLSHWLSNRLLWEKIRTTGGAYGAYCVPDGIEQTMILATYRDPSPVKSLDTFVECFRLAEKESPDENDIEKAVTGCYSREIQPKSPSSRGFSGFIRNLYGITDEIREDKIKNLLSVTSSDIVKAVKIILERESGMTRAVISQKNENFAGKINDLTLY